MSTTLKPWNHTPEETQQIFDILKVGYPLFEEIKLKDQLTMLHKVTEHFPKSHLIKK